MNKQELSGRDNCTKFITQAVRQTGWDEMQQVREEVSFIKQILFLASRNVFIKIKQTLG